MGKGAGSSQNAVSQDSIVISRWIIVQTDFVKSWLCCFIVRIHTWFFLDESGSQVPDGHQLISHIAPKSCAIPSASVGLEPDLMDRTDWEVLKQSC